MSQKQLVGTCAMGLLGWSRKGAWEGSGPSWKAGLESRGDFSKNLSAFILEVSVGRLPWF